MVVWDPWQDDIMFCDPLEGVVVIPSGLLHDVVCILPDMVGEDERVMRDVKSGSSVTEAFQKHRGASQSGPPKDLQRSRDGPGSPVEKKE